MADDSKTEKATPKKRRDERKEGHVFSSKDVIVVVSLLGTFYGLQILFPTIYKTIRENLLYYLNNALAIEELSMAQLSAFGIDAMQVLAICILPLGFIPDLRWQLWQPGVSDQNLFLPQNQRRSS